MDYIFQTLEHKTDFNIRLFFTPSVIFMTKPYLQS